MDGNIEDIRREVHRLRRTGAITGQLKIKIRAVPKARSYTLRFGAVLSGGGAPASWTEQIITSTKPVILDGLTPEPSIHFRSRP